MTDAEVGFLEIFGLKYIGLVKDSRMPDELNDLITDIDKITSELKSDKMALQERLMGYIAKCEQLEQENTILREELEDARRQLDVNLL